MLWSLCRDIRPWESAVLSQSPARTFNAFLLLHVPDHFSVATGRNEGTKTENDNVQKKRKIAGEFLNRDTNRAYSDPQETCCYLPKILPPRRNPTTVPNHSLVIYCLVVIIFYLLLTGNKKTLYLYLKNEHPVPINKMSHAQQSGIMCSEWDLKKIYFSYK